MRGSAARKCSFSAVRPAPGAPAGTFGGRLAVDLRLARVAEPQLEPGADMSRSAGADLRTSVSVEATTWMP